MSDKYEKLATKIGAVVDSKQKAYGNSFGQAGAFLELLYPDGIPVKAYTDALCIVRIWDKLKRLSNLGDLPSNEGKLDAWQDIVGYGLLGLQKDQPTEQPKEVKEEKAAVKDITKLTALELRQLAEKRVKDAAIETKNAKAHLADVEEYLKAYPNDGVNNGVVNHKEFMLDKSALEEAISQTEVPAEGETLEERRVRIAAADMQDRVDRMTPAQREEHDRDVRLVEAGRAIAGDLARMVDKEPEQLKRHGVMGLISAEELSDERKKNVSPEKLDKENLALARLAIEEVKSKSGFEDLMKDIAEADEPRRAQVRAFWDKLETELDSKKERLRRKEVQANILTEIEKAKLKHDASISVEKRYPVGVKSVRETHPPQIAVQVYDPEASTCTDYDKCLVGDDKREPEFSTPEEGVHGVKCSICNEMFKEPIAKDAIKNGTSVVHEECYRERFAKSPE